MAALAKAGYANLYEDEMAMLLSAQTSRGWLRTRRALYNQDHFLQKVGEGVRRLGQGVLHVMQAGSTRSAVFKVFLGALRQKYGRVTFVTDNARSHKSQLIQKYLKSTGGDVVLVCLPLYTPQPKPHRDAVVDDQGPVG